jgi:hypothetical protein
MAAGMLAERYTPTAEGPDQPRRSSTLAIVTASDYRMIIDGIPAELSSGEWIEVRSPAIQRREDTMGAVATWVRGRVAPDR